MDASGKSDAVVQLVIFEAGKDVAGKQWLGDITHMPGELIVSIDSQFWGYRFQSKSSQVAVGAFFLVGVSMNDVPVECICRGA